MYDGGSEHQIDEEERFGSDGLSDALIEGEQGGVGSHSAKHRIPEVARRNEALLSVRCSHADEPHARPHSHHSK